MVCEGTMLEPSYRQQHARTVSGAEERGALQTRNASTEALIFSAGW